ncbi:MAG: DUF2284 domain-containing protein, partial [Promethearchaeota archaeon]
MPSIEIKPENIIFNPEVQTYCNNPNFKCPFYNHSWSCPPNAPYLEKEVLNYDHFYLIYYKFDLNKYVMEEKRKHPNRTKKRIRNFFYRKDILRDKLESEIFSFLTQNECKYSQRLI